ncbi:MAG: Asp23/Gls24 family envelope stress response protein [Firmicutes bacterium]|nr:Asp23/Gls24 family envelope stress response protein [Bacillota bacterium]
MATRTSNRYGKITVTNRAIKNVAGLALRDCYGVDGGRVTDIQTDENKIYMTMRLYLKFGVSPDAVTASIRDAVKYAVEQFTGMRLMVLNLNVGGIR